MSTLVMSLCWPLRMPPTAKAVLISLADNANDQGVCWPSIPTICERTCFSERAVQNAIKWLESAGVVQANRSNGRHTSYIVVPHGFLASGAQDAPAQPMHPRAARMAARAAPPQPMPRTPARAAPVPRRSSATPPQQMPSNRHEPSMEPSRNRQGGVLAVADLVGDGVDAQHAEDWLVLRNAKRLPLTQSAWAMTRDEARKAGLSPAEAVRAAISHGWGSFHAEWWRRAQGGQPAPRAPRSHRFDPVAYVNRNRTNPHHDLEHIIDLTADPMA